MLICGLKAYLNHGAEAGTLGMNIPLEGRLLAQRGGLVSKVKVVSCSYCVWSIKFSIGAKALTLG